MYDRRKYEKSTLVLQYYRLGQCCCTLLLHANTLKHESHYIGAIIAATYCCYIRLNDKCYHCSLLHTTTLHWSSWHLSAMALIFCTSVPRMNQNPSPWNRFRPHETDSAPMKQSPLPLNRFRSHEPALFNPRNRIIPSVPKKMHRLNNVIFSKE